MYKILGADGREYGPVTSEQVRQWITEGRANAATLAIAEGGTQWTPLASFPEFTLLFTISPRALPAGPAVCKTHPLAVTSLVLGVFAVTLGWCCCGLGLPFSTLGLVFAVMALLEIRRQPALYCGRGVAIAGLALCVVNLLVVLALWTGAALKESRDGKPRKVYRL